MCLCVLPGKCEGWHLWWHYRLACLVQLGTYQRGLYSGFVELALWHGHHLQVHHVETTLHCVAMALPVVEGFGRVTRPVIMPSASLPPMNAVLRPLVPVHCGMWWGWQPYQIDHA